MSLGIRSFVLKGISAVDGQAYALRWIDGRQVWPVPFCAISASPCTPPFCSSNSTPWPGLCR